MKKIIVILLLLLSFSLVDPVFSADNNYSIDLENSSSQYLAISDASQNNLDINDDFSIDLWVKPEQLASDAGNNMSLVAKWVTNGYRLETLTANDNLRLSLRDGSSNTTIYDSDSAFFVSGDIGTWVHVTATIDLSVPTVTFYKNTEEKSGSFVSSDATSLANNSDSFNIGSQSNPTGYFDGRIDEVRLWNIILSEQNIEDYYNCILATTTSGLMDYWRMENSYIDIGTSSNDLTAYNSPVFSTDVPSVTNCNEQAATSTEEINTSITIWNDIGIISGITEHYETSSTSPDWVERHTYHIPFFIILILWLVIAFIASKILSILFAKHV